MKSLKFDEEWGKSKIGSIPFMIFGETKEKYITIRLGKYEQTIPSVNGKFIFDLADFDSGYKGYKYVYVNKKRYKLVKSKGALKVLDECSENNGK